jgi:hypothetical protein
MDRVRMVLESDLNQSAKLIALALVTDVPVTGIGISGKSIQRHEAAARAFVDAMPRVVDALAPRVREREKADPEAWLRAQEEDLRQSQRGRVTDVRWHAGDPYRG